MNTIERRYGRDKKTPQEPLRGNISLKKHKLIQWGSRVLDIGFPGFIDLDQLHFQDTDHW